MLRGCRHLACCNKLWEMPSFCPTSSTIACYGWFYEQMMEKCSWYVSSRHWQFRFFLISSHQKIGLDDQIGTYLFFSNVWSVHLSFLLLTLSLSSHWVDPTLIFSSGTCHGLVSRGRVKISSTSSSSQSLVSLNANETGDRELYILCWKALLLGWATSIRIYIFTKRYINLVQDSKCFEYKLCIYSV